MVDGFGLAFTILLAMMALDFITGLMVGFVNKKVSSSVGVQGFIKKLYIVILIGAVYLLEYAGVDVAGYAGDGVAIAYIIIEFVSIVENGGKLGVPIWRPLRDAISALKGGGKNV